MAKEQDIQKAICKYLESLGNTIATVYTAAGIYSRKGVPDIFACLKGRYLQIEVKKPGEVPTKAQFAFMDGINRCGGIAFYATSVQDVKDKLKEYGY